MKLHYTEIKTNTDKIIASKMERARRMRIKKDTWKILLTNKSSYSLNTHPIFIYIHQRLILSLLYNIVP